MLLVYAIIIEFDLSNWDDFRFILLLNTIILYGDLYD